MLAGAFLESDPAGLGDDDVTSVAGEVANVLAGRLHATFQEHKLEASMGLPTLSTDDPRAEEATREGTMGLDQYFRAVDKPVTFEVDLSVEPVASTGGVPVDQETGVGMLRADT